MLLNLRQQVVDGGRWISLAAANFSPELFWLRSAAIQHAAAEHRDYQLLERDFAAVGGDPGAMAATPANIGSAVTRIVKTARVVARLYALQLEELGHV